MQRLHRALLALGVICALSRPALAAAPFLMPGLAEITVEPTGPGRLAVWYGLYLAGPYRGPATIELRRGRTVLGSAKRQLDLADRQTARLGGGAISGNRFGGARPDFLIEARTGSYSLAVVLGNRTLEESFELALVKTTSGSEPGVAASDYLDRASLRLTPPYYDEKCSPKDIFWMTLPTDLRQERTRVDFLFYQDGALVGSFFRDVAVGPQGGEHSRLKVPLRIGGWMENVSKEQVLSRDGEWTVHVIQDGRYLTTCSFAVIDARFAGTGAGSRELECAPQKDATVREATALGARVKSYKPAGVRALEVMALHRSPAVRAMYRRIQIPDLPAAERAKLLKDYRRLLEEQGRGDE